MLRRLKFFAFGALISVIFLSIGPENRMKNTFYAYVNYFNPDKRVTSQLLLADSIIYTNNTSNEIEDFMEGSWVNHELIDKKSYPKVFVLEKNDNKVPSRLKVDFYNKEERKIDGEFKRYNKSVFYEIETNVTISERSFKSYYSLIGIFLLVMIPVSLLVRKLIRRRLEDE